MPRLARTDHVSSDEHMLLKATPHMNATPRVSVCCNQQIAV